MRRRAGLIGLTVLATLLALASAVLVCIGQAGVLSGSRLAAELQTAGAIIQAWLQVFSFPALGALMGIIAGWVGGSWHARSRLRRRSLLLIDPSAPNMPFVEGILHVRGLADEGSRGLTDVAAARLLLQAAYAGQLSVWQTTAAVSRRISARQLRRSASISVDVPLTLTDLPMLMPLSLIRHEVEKLWPGHVTIEHRASRSDRKG